MKEFQAESKRLLDLMINSIYTHKEIFLRELISNASDAIDKLYYRTLEDGATGLSREDFSIQLAVDKEARTLSISDNGIGMTAEDLENNLGTIAKCGSLDFKQENTGADIDITGLIGVGFTSAMLVASHGAVISRPYGSDKAWKWESSGAEGYTIAPCEKDSCGTDVILVVKENAEEENYDEFLDEYRLVGIEKKYSDYIRYPITMYREHTRQKEDAKEGDADAYETSTDLKTIKTMVTLWKLDKHD